MLTDSQKSQVLNLYSMIVADATSSPSELAHLFAWAQSHGLPRADIEAVILSPDGVNYVPPDGIMDALGQLYDLAQMVCADGVVAPEESRLLFSFAKRFGFEPELIPEIVSRLIQEVQRGTPRATLLANIEQGLAS